MNFSPSFAYQQISLSVCECVCDYIYSYQLLWNCTLLLVYKTTVEKLLSMDICSSEMRNRGTEKLETRFSPFKDIYSGWVTTMIYLNEILGELLQKSFYRIPWTKHSKKWGSRGWIELFCLGFPTAEVISIIFVPTRLQDRARITASGDPAWNGFSPLSGS